MRMIDADLLQEVLAKEPMENRTYLRANEIVVDMPTAYDVDKVVERLEKEIDTEVNEYFDYERATKNSHFRKAVEIVKSGGIE